MRHLPARSDTASPVACMHLACYVVMQVVEVYTVMHNTFTAQLICYCMHLQ